MLVNYFKRFLLVLTVLKEDKETSVSALASEFKIPTVLGVLGLGGSEQVAGRAIPEALQLLESQASWEAPRGSLWL